MIRTITNNAKNKQKCYVQLLMMIKNNHSFWTIVKKCQEQIWMLRIIIDEWLDKTVINACEEHY